jgi:hypothetical protein
MTINYSVEVRERYIRFIGEGVEEGLNENIRIHEMIVQTRKEHSRRRVLVDDRNVTYTASILSIYKLAQRYTQAELPRYIERAAALVNPTNPRNNRFYENAARNRGVNVRLFHDMEGAEQWLTT